MSLRIVFVIVLSSVLLALKGQPDPFFKSPGRNVSVFEYRQWADSVSYNAPGWKVSERHFDQFGNLNRELYLGTRDTVNLTTYEVDKKGIIRKSSWYNPMLSKWMKGDVFLYKDGEPHPHTLRDGSGYKKAYSYDKAWNVTEILYTDDMGKNFSRSNFQYDSAGWLKAYQEYEFFDDNAILVHSYVYKLIVNADSSITQEQYLLPASGAVPVTRTDKEGNTMTSFYPNASSKAELVETLFYDKNGRLMSKHTYDKVEFIHTYEYLYIDK